MVSYSWVGIALCESTVVLRVPLLNPSSRLAIGICTVSFHNFKSQNVKLSVSNPTNKYVAYLSVLSQISNCQGPGRKNKFEILKTYRRRQTCDCRTRAPALEGHSALRTSVKCRNKTVKLCPAENADIFWSPVILNTRFCPAIYP